jgi:hypothetical protein
VGDTGYLFVGGPQRAGTSALTRLLNAHPEVALGVERYRRLVRDPARRAEIGPELFEPDRFFRFDPADTPLDPARIYGDLAAFRRKYERASVRGDKLPFVLDCRALLMKRFPRCRFVVIYRDPYRVASSWHARQRRPEKPWPASRDYRQAVAQMNERLGRLAELARRNPRRYLPVRYERLFDPESDTALASLLAWLGLDAVPEARAAHAANAGTARAVAAKPLLLTDTERAWVARAFDWERLEELDRIAAR